MRIAVIGAAGHTGRQVIKQALARGHQAIAAVRHPEALAPPNSSDADLVVRRADVLVAESLSQAVAGADALISTLGAGSSRVPTDLYSHGVVNELAAMAAHGIRRIAVISAAPAGPRAEQSPVNRWVLMPLLDRFFGSSYEDMRRMEAVLGESDRDWISVRPPRLLEKPPTGAYRLDTSPLPKMRTITYGDLAAALLDALGREDLSRQAVYVAN